MLTNNRAGDSGGDAPLGNMCGKGNIRKLCIMGDPAVAKPPIVDGRTPPIYGYTDGVLLNMDLPLFFVEFKGKD